MTTLCLLTLQSVTYSMKAQRVLSERGVWLNAVKLGSEYAAKGCTHGIRFDCRDRRTVERVLRENRIPYSDIKTV
ncbi:MAG: DUF3343 domain-containing protein [Ruminococcaceae bacterium]|nr:DUF3343 domain-containing protein [Oscillospiraceae bacterium]